MTKVNTPLLKQLEGDWKAEGYGKYLEIHNGKLREYHSNMHGCIDKADQTQAQLLIDYAYIERDGNNAFYASPLPFGNKWYFTRTQALSNCEQRQNANALDTFDYFDDFMRQHYAYFEARGFDWDARATAVRATLRDHSSDQQLYNAIDGLLKELGDPHTGLYAVLNNQLVHRLGLYPIKGMSLIRKANPDSAKSDDDLFLEWIIDRLTKLETKMIEEGDVIHTDPVLLDPVW